MKETQAEKSKSGIQKEFYRQKLTDLNGIGTDRIDFTECTFSGINLSGKHFSGILDTCVFLECNLSLTSFETAKLQDVRFRNCKLEGVDFTKCHTLGLVIGFSDCLIRNCNFNFMELKKTAFINCDISETDFVGCNLQESTFNKSRLRVVTFHNTNLTKADFTETQGYLINPLTNNIKEAKFTLPEAVSLLECMGIKLQ